LIKLGGPVRLRTLTCLDYTTDPADPEPSVAMVPSSRHGAGREVLYNHLTEWSPPAARVAGAPRGSSRADELVFR